MSIDIGKLKHTLCATHISVQSRVYYDGKEISLCKMPLDDLKPKREWEKQAPTKLFGPNLEEILNGAGFYRRREWVKLTDEEIRGIHWSKRMDDSVYARAIETKLKEKNT
jgi:hypothetical protein